MNSLRIEVVFADADRQELLSLDVKQGSCVDDVIRISRLPGKFPRINFAELQVGIWGRIVDRSHRVREGDRVEIYRPLAIDPREARRRYAAEGRSMGGTEKSG